MEVQGIPLHPLVVHAVVVISPFSATVAILYAALPRHRWWLRWPLVATALATLVFTWVAAQAGASLLTVPASPEALAHAHAGLRMRNLTLLFTPLALISAWRLAGPSPLRSAISDPSHSHSPTSVTPTAIDVALRVTLVATAVALLGLVALAGHSGASSVWG